MSVVQFAFDGQAHIGVRIYLPRMSNLLPVECTLLNASLHHEECLNAMTERRKRGLAPTKAWCRFPKEFELSNVAIGHARAHPRHLPPDTCNLWKVGL